MSMDLLAGIKKLVAWAAVTDQSLYQFAIDGEIIGSRSVRAFYLLWVPCSPEDSGSPGAS